MNKNLQNFIEKYQLTEQGKFYYGSIQNYQVYIKYDAFAVPAFIGGICANIQNSKNEIQQYLQEHKKELKLVNFEVHDNYILFAVIVFTLKSGLENMEKALLQLTSYFKTLNILDELYCPICGNLMTSKVLSMEEGIPMLIDSSCQDVAIQKRQERIEEFNARPNNYAKGTLGAIGGALIGCVAWILLGAFANLMSGYIAFLIAYLAGIFYDKVGGKNTKIKFLIIGIITLVGIALSILITYLFITAQRMNELGIEGSTFSMLSQLIRYDAEVKQEFISNIIFGVVFGAIGIFLYYFQYKKSIHNDR